MKPNFRWRSHRAVEHKLIFYDPLRRRLNINLFSMAVKTIICSTIFLETFLQKFIWPSEIGMFCVVFASLM